MWDYTGKVMDHFRNPRNTGVVQNPDGLGEVGSLACGDALKLTFKLDDQKERIAEAKFQTFGCASAIASSSALTEMIKGKTLEEAAAITNKDIADYLGGLPEQKMHCSVLGREALELAIENYRTGKDTRKNMEGRVVCNCFGVTEKEIERTIRENGLTDVAQVTHYSKAGGACGNCIPEIETILERIRKEAEAAQQPLERKTRMTVLQKIHLIEETIEREIRPMLQKDNGDLDLMDVIGNRVVISFRGMCAQCNVAQFTMKDVVEAKLREFVAPDLVVEEDKG